MTAVTVALPPAQPDAYPCLHGLPVLQLPGLVRLSYTVPRSNQQRPATCVQLGCSSATAGGRTCDRHIISGSGSSGYKMMDGSVHGKGKGKGKGKGSKHNHGKSMKEPKATKKTKYGKSPKGTKGPKGPGKGKTGAGPMSAPAATESDLTITLLGKGDGEAEAEAESKINEDAAPANSGKAPKVPTVPKVPKTAKLGTLPNAGSLAREHAQRAPSFSLVFALVGCVAALAMAVRKNRQQGYIALIKDDPIEADEADEATPMMD